MTSSTTLRGSGLLLTSILSAVAVMAVGCGSSGKSATTKSASATSAAAATPATAKLPLGAYLVRGQEETGLPPTGQTTHYLTATQWTSNGVPNGAAEAKRLAQEGFREAMSVQTGSTKGQGVSWAMESGFGLGGNARAGGGATGVRLRAEGTGRDALHGRGRPRRRGLGPTEHRRQYPVHGGAVPDAHG